MDIKEIIDKNYNVETVETATIPQRDGSVMTLETMRITKGKKRFDIMVVTEKDRAVTIVV